MRGKILVFFLLLLSFLLGWSAHTVYNQKPEIIKPISEIKPRPLDKYTIENLSQNPIPEGEFEIAREIEGEDDFTTNLFEFRFDPTFSGNQEKTVTGQINIPEVEGELPLVLMIRGYVDQEIYETGMGTGRGAQFFAENGYITVAPDFLGYADSDKESENIFETRFQTYTTTLSLLKSFDQIEKWDGKNIFIWAHSNGGQIALTTLEITRQNIPTTLWAPISKSFPYSILYYTDEADDRGKFLRKELAKFEQTYNPDLYSFDLYLDRLGAPIQIHQGTADDAIPVEWSRNLADSLEELEKEVDLYLYQGANHNLQPSWETAITRDLRFFEANLKE